jgi:hypothetical protein
MYCPHAHREHRLPCPVPTCFAGTVTDSLKHGENVAVRGKSWERVWIEPRFQWVWTIVPPHMAAAVIRHHSQGH